MISMEEFLSDKNRLINAISDNNLLFSKYKAF